MDEFYIAEYTDDGSKLTAVSTPQEVIAFTVDHNASVGISYEETIRDILAALLERAAISPQDMLNLAGLPPDYTVEKWR